MSRSRMNGNATPAAGATQMTDETSPVPAALPVNGHAQAAPETNGNGGHIESDQPDQSVGDPIGEAESLKEVLRHTLIRTNRLIAALRRHKKQSRLVASTLASLRELQSIG